MNSSGIKRGLAASAISALAVVGLPTIAHAEPANDGLAAGAIELYAPGTAASVKNDGVNSTIHLLAVAGSDVTSVKFEYKPAGGDWQLISTATKANGVFSAEWGGPAGGGTVDVRATPYVGTTAGTPDEHTGVVISGTTASVDIANAPGSSVGVFQQPNYDASNDKLLGAISGTTSSATAPTVSDLTDGGTASAADVFTAPTKAGETVAFSGAVDFTGYKFDNPTDTDPAHTAVDEAIVGASAGSDDAEVVTLYKQEITSITAEGSAPYQQGGATTGSAVVTVKDQKGAPIVGAQVIQTGGATIYTNSKGQASFTGLTGTADGTAYTFTVNTTNVAAYDPEIDFQKSVTIKSYAPVLTTLVASSKDGAAFDNDEFATGDLKVVAKDQNGVAMPTIPSGVVAQWSYAPFAGDTANKASTGARFTVPSDGVLANPYSKPGTYTLSYWQEKNAEPGFQAGDLGGSDLVVSVGEATVDFDAANDTVQAQYGTTVTESGKVVLAGSSVALPERSLDIALAPSGDAKLATTQPAGTTRTGDVSAAVKTAADGSFSIAITDPAAVAPATQAVEMDGKLTVSSAALGTLADNTLTFDFLDLGVKAVADAGENDLMGAATPGRPVTVKFLVTNKENEPLKSFPVSFTTDHGFFTDTAATEGDLKPASAPTAGALYGEWNSKGTTFSGTTDLDGYVTVTLAIGRDAGFDDDGAVTAKLVATAGGKTSTHEVDFSSTSPLNTKSVAVEFASDQFSKSLPDAQTGKTVNLDAYALDQFGNRIAYSGLDLSDDNTDADLWDSGSGLKSTDGNAEAYSDEAGSQQVTAKLADTTVTTYEDTDKKAETAPVKVVKTGADGKDLEGSLAKAIAWYDVNLAASTFELTPSVTSPVKVGSTVVVTYTAVDQKGNPITDQPLEFFRSGPDDLQDGEGNAWRETDANGEARYIFQGAKAGDAEIQVVLVDGKTDNPLAEGMKSITVTFADPEPAAPTTPTAPAVAPHAIKAGLKAANKKRDVLTVSAAAPAGTKVVLFKVVKGHLVKVAQGTIAGGKKVFKIKDKNGSKKTTYVAKVAGSSTTLAATTAKKSVK